ncbi:MAG: signal peptidase I [Rhodospirillales bacterium]|jgi:signal peptidase I|nr:signal peptidase I [Rhodospirillales bacterium]
MEENIPDATDSGTSGGFLETLQTIGYAVLIALLIRTFAYEPFSIPSGSMKPTLLIGDYLFVSKFSYGYSHHSLPFSLPLFSGRVMVDEPTRGDVAVFKYPSDTTKDYIKRIVGLPGDKIQVVGGILHINGQKVTRERTSDFIDRNPSGSVRRISRYIETLPNGRKHFILEENGDRGPADNTPLYVVPTDHYFAMGDNRDNSNDSRFSDVRFIPRENLVGRAEFLFFSIDGTVWKIWSWFSTVRFGRMFSGIE